MQPIISKIYREWSPEPDWFNIVDIYNTLYLTDNTLRAIYLLNDTDPVTQINPEYFGAKKVLTSDGTTSATGWNHTWNTSYDKPCSLGYGTRWIAVFNDSPATIVNVRYYPILYGYIGNAVVTSILGNGTATNTNANRMVQAIKCSPVATAESGAFVTNSFSDCLALAYCDIPEGVTTLNNAFRNCEALSKVTFPSSLITIDTQSFQTCNALRKVELNEGVLTIGSNSFNACASLQSISIPSTVTSISNSAFLNNYGIGAVLIQEGWVAPAFNLSAAQYLSVGSMVALSQRLGAAPSTRTITLGNNKNKLSANQIAVFTNKNYSIA